MITYLAAATGNTFLLADCLKETFNHKEFILKLLKIEDRDDALIITDPIEEEGSLSVRMHVLGQDGEFAEFCANGSRAISAYLHEYYPQYENYYIRSKKGGHAVKKYSDECHSITLPSPGFDINPLFISDEEDFKRSYDFKYVEMIEPHLVLKGNVNDETLFVLGQDLNRNKALFPKGININAWHQLKNGDYYVKTYERGVQRLTLSCGTGSLSCASLLGKNELTIETNGGKMRVLLKENELELIGKARIL